MPSTSRTTASVSDHGPVVERSADLDGYHASFVTFAIDVDGAPLLKGLPDDRCAVPALGLCAGGNCDLHLRRPRRDLRRRRRLLRAARTHARPLGRLRAADVQPGGGARRDRGRHGPQLRSDDGAVHHALTLPLGRAVSPRARRAAPQGSAGRYCAEPSGQTRTKSHHRQDGDGEAGKRAARPSSSRPPGTPCRPPRLLGQRLGATQVSGQGLGRVVVADHLVGRQVVQLDPDARAAEGPGRRQRVERQRQRAADVEQDSGAARSCSRRPPARGRRPRGAVEPVDPAG